MTKDIHFQIDLTKDTTTTDICVTPNVPRIRTSFFNRKFRDISGGSDGQHEQLTPTTPKVRTTRPKASSSSGRSRSRRSGGGTGSSSRRLKTICSPSDGRPSRSRPNNNEFYDHDFSTPRAIRSLLTPPKTSTRVSKEGRVTHIIYNPLELDNESSSESSDRYLKAIVSKPVEKKFTTFIPGNCKMDEVLDLFGQEQRSSQTNDDIDMPKSKRLKV